MRIDDVDEVADTSGCMVGAVEMDVDAAGLIRKSPQLFSAFSREPVSCQYPSDMTESG